MWSSLVLPLAGFLIGIVASMTGVGGGIFIVPLLTGLFGFIPQSAVGTSLATIVFTAAAASYFYDRQGRVFFRTGCLLAVTSVPGAYLGAYLTTVISPSLLGLIFGLFLLVVSLRMIIDRRSGSRTLGAAGSIGGETPNDGQIGGQAEVRSSSVADALLVRSRRKIVLGVCLSFFGGLASGFLGIGGGVLTVPIMTLGMGVPIHYATATSMFTMIWTSLSGVAKHALAGHVRVEFAVLLALGTVFGAPVGARVSRRISGNALRRLFGLILLAVSVQMIVRFI